MLIRGGARFTKERGEEKKALFLRGADTPARIAGDGYENGGGVNSTRRQG